MALTLTAETGRVAGSRSSSRLRAEGQVPGVVYGLGRDTVSVTVPWPELRRALSTEAGLNALITLDVDGERDLAIVKDLQRHPVRRSVLHIDFLRVDPNAPVAIDVPIVLVGEAREVENRRGVVDHPLKSLTVNAKPADIPSLIELVIDDLDIGVTVTVAELTLPEGVTTDVDPDAPVVTGMATRFSVQLDHGVDLADLDADGELASEGAEGESDAAAEGDAE
ncbi:MAG TPA: 50S ribosomal protein L25 [Acidimicrobiales bacterium]